MRREANDSSGCRVPYVTGVRYRIYSVSKETMRLVAGIFRIRKMLFLFFYRKNPAKAKFIVNTGWHHEKIVPGISFREMSGFFYINIEWGTKIMKRVYRVYKKTVSIVNETATGMYEIWWKSSLRSHMMENFLTIA